MVARGMLKFWVLKLLSRGSKTGYELIKEIEREVGWQPSPGSVYPLLQMLARRGSFPLGPWETRCTGSLPPKDNGT